MTNVSSFNKLYISGKVKSCKWRPSNYEESSTFTLGTWDEDINGLYLYDYVDKDADPVCLQEIFYEADVNSIQYISRDTVAIGLGSGDIHLYNHNKRNQLESKHVWEKCHSTRAGRSASSHLASNGELIASVGEDGRIVIVNVQDIKMKKVLDSEKDCHHLAVVFSKMNELLTSNLKGYLHMWDLRASESAKGTFVSPDHVSIHSLSIHPTQQHVVAAGCEDGSVALWDIRNTNQPFALIVAHSGHVNSILFHPNYSDHLFTCGNDGQVLHWNAASQSNDMLISPSVASEGIENVWLSNKVAAGIIDTINLVPSSVLPLNCVDIESMKLLAGSDNEAVYIIDKVLN